jgi:hypothetical protein
MSFNAFAAVGLFAGVLLCAVTPSAAGGLTREVAIKTDKADKTVASEAGVVLRMADQAIEKQEWFSANELLKQGIASIGFRFYLPDVIDDSEFSLAFAESKERGADLQTAAQVRRTVLASRLTRLQEKIAK